MAKLFKITRLPERAILLFGGVPILLNQNYDSQKPENFSIENNTDFRAVPMDSFDFIAEVDGKVSQNSATCFINFAVEAGVPAPFDFEYTIDILGNLNFTDYVEYQNTFDRIIIDEVTGKQGWSVDCRQVKAGDVFFYYEIFNKMIFSADEPGAEDNYSNLAFRFADISGAKGIKNNFKVNVLSKAVLVSDQTFTDKSTDELKIKEFSFSIENQIVGKSFDITVETSVASIADDVQNGVFINNEFGVFESHLNGSSTIFDINTNQEGRTVFYGSLRSVADFNPADFIKITLNSIDGDTALVDASKNILTFNI